MISEPGTHHDFSEAAAAELPEYRRFSGWAIAALVLGIVSPLALASPVLWLLPALGIVAALIAIWQVSTDEQLLMGRTLAYVGLVLSAAFLAAAPTRIATRHRWLDTRSELITRQWIEYLQAGEVHKAVELTRREVLRRPLDDTLPAAYENDPESKRDLAAFLKRPLVERLMAAGRDAKLRLTNVEFNETEKSDVVTRNYDLEYSLGDQRRTVSFEIRIERMPDRESGGEHWRVAWMDLADSKP